MSVMEMGNERCYGRYDFLHIQWVSFGHRGMEHMVVFQRVLGIGCRKNEERERDTHGWAIKK